MAIQYYDGVNIVGGFKVGDSLASSSFEVEAGGDILVNTVLKVSDDFELSGAFYDSNDQPGTAGQILSSTSNGTDWIDASSGGSGTVTSITATSGALGGLTGGTITTSGSIALDYSGNNNFILASNSQLTSTEDDDVLAIVDVSAGRQVKYIEKSDLLEDQVTSVTTGEPNGSDSIINIVSLTQAEYDAGTPVATTLYIIT